MQIKSEGLKVCCRGLNDIWVHGADGSVYMCGWTGYCIGNLTEQTIEKIWHGELARQFRESMLDGSYRYCDDSKCPYRANGELGKNMAGECALRLYLMREDYSLTKGFLIDLGFETDRIYHLGGERMRRDDGFAVEIYDHIPYKTPAYKKQMRQLFEKAHLLEGYTFVSGLDDKTRLAYLLARASYLYVTRELLVRQLLDLYLLHKKLKEEDLEREWLWLKKLKIGQLSEKLLSLSYVWFGTKAERADLAITVSEDLELYDEMENRILGYGKEYEATIPEALALAGSILKEEEKENRKARRKLFLQKTRELRKQLWELLREYLPRKEKK